MDMHRYGINDCYNESIQSMLYANTDVTIKILTPEGIM